METLPKRILRSDKDLNNFFFSNVFSEERREEKKSSNENEISDFNQMISCWPDLLSVCLTRRTFELLYWKSFQFIWRVNKVCRSQICVSSCMSDDSWGWDEANEILVTETGCLYSIQSRKLKVIRRWNHCSNKSVSRGMRRQNPGVGIRSMSGKFSSQRCSRNVLSVFWRNSNSFDKKCQAGD